MAGAAASPGADPAASGWKVWLRAKAQSSFDALTTKDYERGKTPVQIKHSRRAKLGGYVSICMLGLGTMHRGGAQKLLEHMNQGTGNKELANNCVRFLTFCSLLGLTAGSLHTTAPWAVSLLDLEPGSPSSSYWLYSILKQESTICKLFILLECFVGQFVLVPSCSGSTDFACCWQSYHIICVPPFVPDKRVSSDGSGPSVLLEACFARSFALQTQGTCFHKLIAGETPRPLQFTAHTAHLQYMVA